MFGIVADTEMAWRPRPAALRLPRLMTSLIELVRLCRKTKTLHVRMRFAEEIVFQVGPALLNYIRRRTRRDFVEDASQETLIAITCNLDQCQARTGPQFWRWCYQTACHKMADQWRQTAGAMMVSLDHAEIGLAVEASGRDAPISYEEREQLDYALALLREAKPPCVDYLWDRFALDLTYKEMAEIYGLSENAARMQVNRCLKLAQELVSKKAKVTHG